MLQGSWIVCQKITELLEISRPAQIKKNYQPWWFYEFRKTVLIHRRNFTGAFSRFADDSNRHARNCKRTKNLDVIVWFTGSCNKVHNETYISGVVILFIALAFDIYQQNMQVVLCILLVFILRILNNDRLTKDDLSDRHSVSSFIAYLCMKFQTTLDTASLNRIGAAESQSTDLVGVLTKESHVTILSDTDIFRFTDLPRVPLKRSKWWRNCSNSIKITFWIPFVCQYVLNDIHV